MDRFVSRKRRKKNIKWPKNKVKASVIWFSTNTNTTNKADYEGNLAKVKSSLRFLQLEIQVMLSSNSTIKKKTSICV